MRARYKAVREVGAQVMLKVALLLLLMGQRTTLVTMVMMTTMIAGAVIARSNSDQRAGTDGASSRWN